MKARKRITGMIAVLVIFLMAFGMMPQMGIAVHAEERVPATPFDRQDNKEVPYDGSLYDLKGLNPDNATVKPTIEVERVTLDTVPSDKEVEICITVKGAADKYAPTGLHVCYDTRLTWVTEVIDGRTIYGHLGDAGEYLGWEQQGGTGYAFLATAASDDVGQDGVLWKMKFRIPDDAKIGDLYPIGIQYMPKPGEEDLFTNGDKDEQGQLIQAYVFTRGIKNGYIRIGKGHIHDETFCAWTDAMAEKQNGSGSTASNSLPGESGSYYLTKNVELGDKKWNVPAGTTNLCLNGCSIISKDDDYAVRLEEENSVLNLFDEEDAASPGRIISKRGEGVRLEESTTFNMYGGEIYNCDEDGVVLKETKARFHMYGGKITGCDCGVYIDESDAEFVLHNGEITGNKMGVKAYGRFIIRNGSVTNNTNGVYTYATEDRIILQGRNIAPVITGNKEGNIEKNLILNVGYGQKIKVEEGTTISSNARIGISMTDGDGPVEGVFTGGLSGKLPQGKTAADLFSSDDPKYIVDTSNGEASLKRYNRSPVGYLDAVDNQCESILVQGWAFDPDDMTKALAIHVYIGGPAGSAAAGSPVGIEANALRKDVNKAYEYKCGDNHGFSAVIPTDKLGEQPVYVYALDLESTDKNILVGSKTVTITPKNTDPMDPGTSAEAVEKNITERKSEKDSSGSSFSPLQLKSVKQTKKSVKLTWKKVKQAKKYVIYGSPCGTENKVKKITTVTGNSYTVTKAAGKKIKKGTYYKFVVVALDANNKVVSISKMVHAATKGGKVGNYVSITTNAKKNKVTLKPGKTFKLKAKAVLKAKKIHIHRRTSYESSNTSVATVSSKGVIKAKTKGTCYVYVYVQNGLNKAIKVTVK